MGPLAAAPGQTLRNHVPQAVGESRRIGALSRTARLDLAIGLPLRNPEELDRLLERVSNPASPNYRSYLSASEFAERFGPTQGDYDKLIQFVQANGFVVSGTHPNRMILDVTGPVSAIDQTFHLSMTAWEHPKRGIFFAPDRDPSVEVDVALLDIAGLDNFVLPEPMDVKAAPLSSAGLTPTPLTTGSGIAGLFIGKDFRAAYAPGVTMTGAAQTVALVEFDGFFAADVTANFKQAGLPAVPVQTILLDGFNGVPGSGNIEVTLDIMMAGYMAPGVSVIVYEGLSPNDVLNRIATDNSARQISCSWTFSPINATTEQIFKQMVAQGQSFLQASGDSGEYTGAIATPADDPNITVVGGTALTTTGPGGPWLSESAWSGSGGGVSTTYAIPSYQQSVNMAAQGGSSTMRNIPDVALTAAVQLFLIANNGGEYEVGGTSAAAPLWAGFITLANQQAAANKKAVLGFLNPTLYALGKGSTYSSDLHDITTGSNGVAAIPGYDLATGWGTPAGQSLINDLISVPSTPSFTLSTTPATVSAQVGTSATATVQVTAQNGFSGKVTLSATGLPSGVTATFGALSSGGASTLTLSVSSAVAPNTYTLSIQGVSGTLTSSVGLSLQVTGLPGYSLKASATAVAVAPGGTGADSITVVPVNGFNAAVSLTISGLPAGVTAAFSPASTAAASTLTFTASASAATSTTTVTVTGKSGSLTATVAVTLTVGPLQSFSLTPSASTLSVVQGASTADTLTVVPKNGFNGAVAFTLSGLPAGVAASFSPNTAATAYTATFTASSAATTGTSTVTVTGTAGTLSSPVALSLTVKAGPSFTLAAAPSSLSVTQGASGSSTITVTPANGFTGSPSLTVSGLPTGVTAAFSPASTSSTSKLTLTASASATAGLATVTITGTSGAISAHATLAMTVAAAPGFKLSAPTSNVNVPVGGAGTAAIAVAPQGGFSGAVAFTVSGLPTGVTASFSPATSNTGSTLTLTAASSAALKATALTVTGTSGSLTSSLPIAVTVVAPPDFALSFQPASLNVAQGGKGSSTISATSINGFTGTITLSTSGLPAGVTVSFSAIGGAGSLLVTFTVASSATAATSHVTLTGTSGSLSHGAVLNLTVVAPTAGTALVDLSPYYNVSGSAIDYAPFTNGGLDAGGRSYSGMLLGASQNVGGTIYSLGPMGASDAVSGGTVTLPAGQFTSLKLLATGVNGNQTGQTFTVTYSDGSTAVFTQSLSDWATPANYSGESTAVATGYRDNSVGTVQDSTYNLYGYSFSLNGAKTVRSIALPANRNVVALAITLAGSVTPSATVQADLSKAFNGIGITSDGKAFTGGLDGLGYAYSGSLLQSTEVLGGIPFQLGAADKVNVVSGASGAIALPAGKYSSLLALGTGVNGAQLAQPFKVTYTDGSTVTFTQSLSDWFTPGNYAGEAIALAMGYRNTASGAKDSRPFMLYEYTFSLNNTKTVSSISLPAGSNVKVFAIGLKP